MSEHLRQSHVASGPFAKYRLEAAVRQAELHRRLIARQQSGIIALQQAETSRQPVIQSGADKNGDVAEVDSRCVGVSSEPIVLAEARLRGVERAFQLLAEMPQLHAQAVAEHFATGGTAGDVRSAYPLVSHLINDVSLSFEQRDDLARVYNVRLAQLNLADHREGGLAFLELTAASEAG